MPIGNRGESSISMRGFGYTDIGLFLDGIPVSSIYDKQTDWGQFSSFGIAEISVAKGYTSPLYGMNAMGGAVNVITSKPTKAIEFSTRAGIVADNQYQFATSVGTNQGKYYFQASYAYTDRQSFPFSREQARLTGVSQIPNSYYSNQTFRAKAGWQPNQNHEYSLNFIYQKGSKGGAGASWQWPHYDKMTAYILGNSHITNRFSINTKLYYDSFYNQLSATFRGVPQLSTYNDYTLGGILTFGYDFSKDMSLKAGLNIKQDNHNNYDALVRSTPDTKLQDISSSVFAEYAHRINNIVRYVISGSYNRNDSLRLLVDGGRGDKLSLQGWTLQGIGYINLTDWAMLHVNIGHKTNLPTLKERFSKRWGYSVPNPNLNAQSALNYEIGATFDHKSTKATLAVFYNDLINTFGTVSMPNSSCSNGVDCYQFVNARGGYIIGTEVGIKQGFWDERIQVGLNYTWTQKWLPGGLISLGYPPHMANATFQITPINQFDFIAMATYRSKAVEQIAGGGLSYLNSDFMLIDLKANYRFTNNFSLSVGAYNLLDKDYRYGSWGNSGFSYSVYYPGRRFFASIEYKF